MSETEEILSAKEVADELGIGAAMLRRYAATYEKVSGKEIDLHRREGRQFTRSQVDTLLEVRRKVQGKDMSLDAAMEVVLNGPEIALEPRPSVLRQSDSLEAFKAALDPLLSELQSIRGELSSLRRENKELREREILAVPIPVEKSKPGGVRRLIRKWLGFD